MSLPDGRLEWLETNELGSFALGSVDRKLRRKYHALLTVRDPGASGTSDAWNLLAEVREVLQRDDECVLVADPLGSPPFAIEGQSPRVELLDFQAYPHACHRYRVSLGRGPAPVGALDVELERSVRLGTTSMPARDGTRNAHDQVELHYRVQHVTTPLRLTLEPLLRCRPLHELTHENPFLDGTCVQLGDEVRMLPYAGMPAIALRVEGLSAGHSGASARFEEQGSWCGVPLYDWEAARGYAAQESLFCPGRFVIDVDADCAFTLVVALHRCTEAKSAPRTAVDLHFMAKLERAAGQFFMRTARGGRTLIAGFPWFGAWSRDALIALPGLYLATLDWERCEAVLEGLAEARTNGLVPNLPAQAGAPANTGSVDASLLFVRAVQWFAEQLGRERVARFMPVVCELLEALAAGSDPRMRLDHGVGVITQPGSYALTWMDAMVDGAPVTARAGYAVDIDALAYNAVHFACAWADGNRPQFARAFRTRLRHAEGDFIARYWDDSRGYLADGHDGHQPDPSLRPNQLWALALPYRPISSSMARSSLQVVSRELFTPAGLRTLSPSAAGYRGRYAGTQPERDRAYHQGTVWPWLLGVYADALRATHGHSVLAPRLGQALDHLAHHIDHEGCVGQISEVFDGDAPHAAGGAPAQAWSVAELYRVVRLVHDVSAVDSRPDQPEGALERGKTQPPEHTPSL
jgi:glycogen debranching enzyme